MNAKLAKKFRKLLQLRTAPKTEYMQHKTKGFVAVPRDTPQGIYREIKRARLTKAALASKNILGTKYV